MEDLTGFVEGMAEREVRTVFATDLMALLVLKSPGAMGADVVVGSSQRFGVPMGYGGPHAAFFAARNLQASLPRPNHRRVRRPLGPACVAHGPSNP